MPKSERFGIGQKIDHLFIELLEQLHRASYAAGPAKISALGATLLIIDSLRFFIQLTWELKLIPTAQFSELGQEIETIGKMVGGWRKGLLAKTPPRTNS
ncbi:four helix bundle protein [Candidatus Berkelbacteria bacterium]|nr:four helix bundle protein [Candidatus Berkelbacteria bacterium]